MDIKYSIKLCVPVSLPTNFQVISQTAEAQKIRQLQNPNHFQNRLTFLNKLRTFFSSLNKTFGRKFQNIFDCRAFPSVENIAISQTAEAQKIRQLQNPNHFQNRLTFLNKLSDFIDCRSSENSSTTKPKSFLESLDICKQTQNILQQFE